MTEEFNALKADYRKLYIQNELLIGAIKDKQNCYMSKDDVKLN